MRMRKDDLFPGGRLVSAWHAVRRGSFVFSNGGLRRIIEEGLTVRTFEELRIPAQVVATDIESGEEHWFASGEIMGPLLASAAMPGVFPPVAIEGTTYIDGGVANNVPVSKAIELGAKRVYVLNVHAMSQPRPLNRPYDFMMHGLVLARAGRFRREIARFREQAEVIEFPIVDVGHVAFTNLSQTERLIEAGYESGRAVLAIDREHALGLEGAEARG
jgi:NTE family protein